MQWAITSFTSELALFDLGVSSDCEPSSVESVPGEPTFESSRPGTSPAEAARLPSILCPAAISAYSKGNAKRVLESKSGGADVERIGSPSSMNSKGEEAIYIVVDLSLRP
mmetsp:Transcript_9733/g.19020  ORF Transcript_9733/g.19020 Transcript_9733/m.19020 type:complete len:110 (-) Transcript_9733:77-406(-)